MTAAEFAARVRRSQLRNRFLGLLDRCLLSYPKSPVRDVLRLADPDPYREAVRDAIAADEMGRETFRRLLEQPEALKQPPEFLIAILDYGATTNERRLQLLKLANERRPSDVQVLLALSAGNADQPIDDKIRWAQAAVAAAPNNPAVYNRLGFVLKRKGDWDGALAAYRTGRELEPNFWYWHFHIAEVQMEKSDYPAAVASYRRAVELPADHPFTRAMNRAALADALRANGELDAALAMYAEALEYDQTLLRIHVNYGNALRAKGDLEGAIERYRIGLKYHPREAGLYSNLGNALKESGDLNGALAAQREAVRLNPKLALAHNNLGQVLREKGELEAAIAAFREAVRLDPNNATMRNNLATCERMRELLLRLDDVEAGRVKPASPRETCEYANLCGAQFLKRHATGVRLFESAFAADPALLEDLDAVYRYNAACFAALAGSGKGVGVPDDPAERAVYRAKALAWLQAELAAVKRLASANDPAKQKNAADRLKWWFRDRDLANLRPGSGRIGMLAAERALWDAFWSDVRDELNQISKSQPAG